MLQHLIKIKILTFSMENDDTKKYGTFDESDGSDSDVNTNYHFDSNEIIGKIPPKLW